MINRAQAPAIQSVQQLTLHQPNLYHLDNKIPVYEINLGKQAVIKLELIFKAGRWYEKERLIARATSQLLKAGSLQSNAEQMANFFEYFGAKLDINDGFNTVNIQVYCLSKHLKTLLPKLYELLTTPAFPEEELQKFIKRNQQNLRIQLQKNDIVAYRLFTERLFGADHPYGYNSNDALYQQVDTQKIKTHFKENYIANTCTIILAGQTQPEHRTLLNQYFGQLPYVDNYAETSVTAMPQTIDTTPIHQSVSAESLQASIRIGRLTFPREHADCNQFYMMNMVLGGYFGARLMQNLRERHGYTYGVYSSIETLAYSGYWYIHTDVGKDVKDAALAEIYHELERLQNTPISEEELEMVRNYTLGMQLTALDGVFNIAGVIKSLVTINLDHQFFYDFIDTVKTISAQEVQLMAQKYLNKADLLEVVIE